MNGMKLNHRTAAFTAPGGGPVPWGDIDRMVQEGRRLQAEALANAIHAAIGETRRLLGALSPEARAQAAAERAAKRLRVPAEEREIARGLFWPHLSWVAHEGARWLGIVRSPEKDQKDQRAA